MNTRKDFLLASSFFALAPAAAGAASPTASSSPKGAKPSGLTFDFDQTRFNEILAKPAKHKQCFGATKIDGGTVIYGMTNTMDAYQEYLGEAPGSVQTVTVLYHGASIALAMTSAVWNDVIVPTLKGVPASVRSDLSDAKPGKGNPYLSDVNAVVKRGASFFVCHNAIAGFAGVAAGILKQPRDKVHAAVIAGMLPGALVVPAGVMAINACQEAKFTYIQSSV